MTEPMPVAIEYATPRRDLKPMSLKAAKWVFWLSLVPPVVGVGILLLYRLTAYEQLTVAGFFWLAGGGGLAFVCGVIALVSFFRATTRKPRDVPIVWRYAVALVICLLSLPLAWGCAMLGGDWMNKPHFHMQVTNATSVALDKVVIHFTSGDVAVGPLAPGQATNTGLLWVDHQEMIRATVVANGLSRTQDERKLGFFREPGSAPNFQPFTIVIEPRELPGAQKQPAPSTQP